MLHPAIRHKGGITISVNPCWMEIALIEHFSQLRGLEIGGLSYFGRYYEKA